MSAIAQSGTVGQTVHLCTGYLQPIASDDVAAAMTEVALGPPVNGTIEIAGPERASQRVRRAISESGERPARSGR